MRFVTSLILLFGALTMVAASASTAAAQDRPNIVYILADDLGLGDVRSYTNTSLGNGTPNSPVLTPNIDSLSTGGMRFTNAHASNSICSPTRYSILTGQYAWRTALRGGGIVGQHQPAIIEPDRSTVADMLQQQGYSTGMFGKWHLGMNWVTTDGNAARNDGSNVDYSQPFTGGPTDNGFDTYFGDDVINWPPFAFIEDDRTVGIPTIPYGASNSRGLKTEDYEWIDSLPEYTGRAVQYINDQANTSDPFFMYMTLTAPHLPVVPPDFITDENGYDVGNTEYDRFIATVDWAVGQVLGALETQGIRDETMIIFTSDNGVSTGFSTSDDISPGFIGGTPLRGSKDTIWEGGHRMPLIVEWNGQVEAGSVSTEYVELNDFYGTVADILNVAVPSDAAEDSYSILPVLQGTALSEPLREAGVNQDRGIFAVRHVDEEGTEWKLIVNSSELYNLTNDVGETTNLLSGGGTAEAQAKADELQLILAGYIASGRSAPLITPEPGSVCLLMLSGFGALMLVRRNHRRRGIRIIAKGG